MTQGDIMNDRAIEQEIKTKGLAGPIVSMEDIEANIADCYYFTGEDGAKGAMEQLTQLCGYHTQLKTLTFCVLILRNGFTIVGTNHGSAAIENFDAELGRKYSRENAIEQMWPLMGYVLKQRLHEGSV